MEGKKVQVNDRVRRLKVRGCAGIVKEIRSEVTASSEQKDKGLIVSVLWDNGTLSYFAPEALEVI